MIKIFLKIIYDIILSNLFSIVKHIHTFLINHDSILYIFIFIIIIILLIYLRKSFIYYPSINC